MLVLPRDLYQVLIILSVYKILGKNKSGILETWDLFQKKKKCLKKKMEINFHTATRWIATYVVKE